MYGHAVVRQCDIVRQAYVGAAYASAVCEIRLAMKMKMKKKKEEEEEEKEKRSEACTLWLARAGPEATQPIEKKA